MKIDKTYERFAWFLIYRNSSMENTESNHIPRDGNNISLWQSIGRETINATIKDEKVWDTLIVGGGITGITTALLLQREGHRCILAEGRNLGFGTTGGTTAHLNTFLDTSYPEIDNDFSSDASLLMAKASKNMISFIEQNIRSLNMQADFEYKQGYLFSQNKNESEELQSILESSVKAGIEVNAANKNGIGIPYEDSICFEQQAQFHPLKYIQGISKEFLRLGGEIYEETFIEGTELKDGIHHAFSGAKTTSAKNIVYATHIPPGINILSLRNAPYRSYVLAVELRDGNYPDCLAYDMKEPYHYYRSHVIEGKKYLIVGGEDHKTGHGDPEKAFTALEAFARKTFEVSSVGFRWSSQYYVPVDGLPYIGQLPGGDKNAYVATGFNGNGMILGTLSARIISDLILGKENQYTDLLSPSRSKPVSGFTEFVKENADVAYHFFADRFGSEVLSSTEDLEPGEGKVVSFGGDKLAIHKSMNGEVTALDPVCTHAGCIVNWNAEEKSWDCPCHGGRFSAAGKVLTGPPRKDLKTLDINQEMK